MAPRAYKVEPLSPGHWDRITPPVDQELWKRYLNEDDSDSDSSDTEHGEMAGPLSSAKSTRPEAPEGKPKNKDELVNYHAIKSRVAVQLTLPRDQGSTGRCFQ